jgi:hypothetical protein
MVTERSRSKSEVTEPFGLLRLHSAQAAQDKLRRSAKFELP